MKDCRKNCHQPTQAAIAPPLVPRTMHMSMCLPSRHFLPDPSHQACLSVQKLLMERHLTQRYQ